jgi:hypothetical protein
MKSWLDFMRPWAYVAVGGILLTIFLWLPLRYFAWATAALTAYFIGLAAVVGLIGLLVVGTTRLARRFVKPS